MAQVLKKYDLDILSISEANVFKEDDLSDVKIGGYDLLCDNLLESGRTRSAIYISQNLQYKLRNDLMDSNTPEVWIEVSMRKNKKGDPVIIGQFYREMAVVRGKRGVEGTSDPQKQKERLQDWIRKIHDKLGSTN